ncbi:DUF1127 domain-containing protein [Cribrihabitans neustonicus]|uniref:DUF1127 domain-containing protein n=1 Tax=Cribrihabitans neustonicus TaxID=1429085 RepID=UPI003B598674
MTTANLHAPLGAVTVLRVVDSILDVKNSVVTWYLSRQTRKELSKLTDSQLHDIGLTRLDIAKF